jgi:hypothetical protein
MHSGLFSAYRQGENRVTSSVLAVFERLDVGLLRRILATASGNPEMALLTFTNQVRGEGGGSVPDGAITANVGYYFEVKTDREAVREAQLREHVRHLDGRFRDERLFVLTPDRTEPPAVRRLGDPRLTWFAFRELGDAIDDVLADRYVEVPELQRYLLRELLALFDRDGLLSAVDTVIVPVNAQSLALYRRRGVYLCQPGRSISEQVHYVGFYADGEIKPEIARILHRRDEVVFETDLAVRATDSCLGQSDPIYEMVLELLKHGEIAEDTVLQMFILSKSADALTLRLPEPVVGDATSPTGRHVAWTRNQRYVYSDDLRTAPRTTTELDRLTAARQP